MPAFPDGHFYSPVIDAAELRRREASLWPEAPPEVPGVDFRDAEQRALLAACAPYAASFRFPRTAEEAGPFEYYEENGQFAGLDARMWYALLQLWRPRRVIEVGSGFSSLLAADANRRHLGGRARITCIEPYPRPFLREGVPGIEGLVEQPVQDVPLALFEELGEGDVLFIDSSHVVKTGSDVVFLYLQVLPRLRAGVRIHAHDIFLPRDYPKDWVLGEERSWSEQYLLQALLVHSPVFEMSFGCAYAAERFPQAVREVFGAPYGGGSLYLRKTR